jgi:hypothetical protein
MNRLKSSRADTIREQAAEALTIQTDGEPQYDKQRSENLRQTDVFAEYCHGPQHPKDGHEQ